MYNLDEIGQLTFDNEAVQYIPSEYRGHSGKDNNLVVFLDRVGVYDVAGLRKAVTGQEYIMYRMKVGANRRLLIA